MRRAWQLGLLGLLLGAAPGPVVVGSFSLAGGELPEGWVPLHFPKIAEHTRYAVVQDAGTWVVRADSRASASGLIRRVRVDLREHPILRWRWRVENVLEAGDVTRRDGDDYPARVYVTFEYDPDTLPLWQRLKYLAARALRPELPAAAISYIWASRAEPGAIVDNPYAAGFVKMIVVRSGAGEAGTWREEQRNVLEDFRAAFGREPPPLVGVAIMTDTDNTGESAVAYYGDIVFLPDAG